MMWVSSISTQYLHETNILSLLLQWTGRSSFMFPGSQESSVIVEVPVPFYFPESWLHSQHLPRNSTCNRSQPSFFLPGCENSQEARGLPKGNTNPRAPWGLSVLLFPLDCTVLEDKVCVLIKCLSCSVCWVNEQPVTTGDLLNTSF